MSRQHVHRGDLHLVDLSDGSLDLELADVVPDRERVLATLRLVHRLLANHRTEDDLVSGQAHAYTSSILLRAGCSITTVSALRTATTLSESARMTSTPGRFRAERIKVSLVSGAARTSAGAVRRPRRRLEIEENESSPGGHCQFPSGGTASCRRRKPHHAS